MANFICDEAQISHLIEQLEQSNMYDDQMVENILFQGGEIMVAELKNKMEETGHIDTGETKKHIAFKRVVTRNKDQVPGITVTVNGARKDGQRYGTVAFVLNYGRKKKSGHIQGSYFWNRGLESASEKITINTTELAETRLRKKGLI